MNTIHWRMHNCDCVIAYEYDPAQGDSPDLRSNHTHISKCQFHQALDGKALHDELCVEQDQVSICHKKIIEIHPEVSKDGSIDSEKVFVSLDDKRDITAVVSGLDAQEITTLETALKGVCDRDVKVM